MQKYKLIELATDQTVAYGDNPNQIFGGPWGDSTKYQWRENIISPEQQKNERLCSSMQSMKHI